ncbi:MAG: aminotransferase class IV, partial [Bacteroidales bacterium]
KYIDEAGAANFFGIKNNTYCTPKSSSILQSITNMSLRQLAKDMGMKVEERPIPVEELSTFDEVAACGTAAVISPISQIQERATGKVYDYGTEAGPVCTKLYEKLKGIQEGEIEDIYNWNTIVE